MNGGSLPELNPSPLASRILDEREGTLQIRGVEGDIPDVVDVSFVKVDTFVKVSKLVHGCED